MFLTVTQGHTGWLHMKDKSHPTEKNQEQEQETVVMAWEWVGTDLLFQVCELCRYTQMIHLRTMVMVYLRAKLGDELFGLQKNSWCTY